MRLRCRGRRIVSCLSSRWSSRTSWVRTRRRRWSLREPCWSSWGRQCRRTASWSRSARRCRRSWTTGSRGRTNWCFSCLSSKKRDFLFQRFSRRKLKIFQPHAFPPILTTNTSKCTTRSEKSEKGSKRLECTILKI